MEKKKTTTAKKKPATTAKVKDTYTRGGMYHNAKEATAGVTNRNGTPYTEAELKKIFADLKKMSKK